MNKEEIAFLLRNKQKKIGFDEEDHIYFMKDRRLISVTTLIKQFTPQFNKDDAVSTEYAQRHGMTNEAVKEMWAKEGEKGCSTGTLVHHYSEQLLCGLNPDNPKDKRASLMVDSARRYIKSYTPNIISAELIVYSEKYGVAGQIDFITYNEDGTIDIWDWKTNKKIEMGNQWNRFYNPPLQKLADNVYNKYSLQLSIYAKLLEDWGFMVRNLHLVHLSTINSVVIRCPYLKKEAEYILEEGEKI